MPPLLSRLWSPSGFGLIVLLLLFPFVGVSCSDQDLGTLDGSYTGFDLVTGGAPTYDVDSPTADMVAIEQVVFPDPGAQILAIALIVLLAAGLATALIPTIRLHQLTAAAIAALAAVLLVVTQLVAQSALVSSMRDLLLPRISLAPQDLSPITTEEYLSDATGSRIGFWLALVGLLAIALTNIVIRLRSRRTAA